MRWAADKVVERFPLPELPMPAQESVDGVRGERLPHLKDILQFEPFSHRHQHMNVVRHDYPLVKVVALPI
jgi:hypothetical protein